VLITPCIVLLGACGQANKKWITKPLCIRELIIRRHIAILVKINNGDLTFRAIK